MPRSRATQEMLEAAEALQLEQNPDRVAAARKTATFIRDELLAIAEDEERLKQRKAAVLSLRQKDLVDLMNAAGMDSFGLPPEGNMPGYDVKKKPYYNIKKPTELDDAFFEWLDTHGFGSLVKRIVTISFDRTDKEREKRLMNWIIENEMTDIMTRVQSIHPSTLSAFVKREHEAGDVVLPAKLLGLEVGEIAEVVERKEKKLKST